MEIVNKILNKKEFKKPKKIRNFTIKIYEPLEHENLMSLYETLFPGYMTDDLWQWKSIKNPFGTYYTFLLKDHEKIIAAYSVAPKRFYIKGLEIDCIQSLDTMTDPKYQGRGSSTYLANLIYEYSKLNEKLFVYGFPNKASQYLFEVKLQWNLFGKMSLFIKDIVKTKRYFKGHNLYSIKEISKFDETINNICETSKKNYLITLKRDKQYLNWRFVENPTTNYKKFLIFNEKTDNIVAYFILKRYRGKNEEYHGHIVDFIILPREINLKKQIFTLIESFSLDIFKANCMKMSFWLPDNDLKEFIVLKLGYDIMKNETYFGCKLFQKCNQFLLLKSIKNWYITMSNNDIF